MPRQKKTAMKGRRRVSKPKSKRTYRKRHTVTTDNLAKCSDMFTSGGSNSFVVQTDTAENWNFTLSQFPRALQIAKEYREFKLDYIECRIKPYYDSYTIPATTPNNAVVFTKAPQLYTQILKDGATAPGDAGWFRANGINPKSLAKDGNHVIRFKPAILLNASTGITTPTNVSGQIKVSPWMSYATAQSVQHYGIGMLFDSQEASALTANIAEVEFEAHFLFRKPNYTASTSDNYGRVKVNGQSQA